MKAQTEMSFCGFLIENHDFYGFWLKTAVFADFDWKPVFADFDQKPQFLPKSTKNAVFY